MKPKRITSNPDLLTKLVHNLVLAFRLMLDRRVSGTAKLIPLLTVLYILSPLDLLPEVAFGPLGVVDDLGVFLLGLQTFIYSAPREVRREYRGEAPDKSNAPKVIEGQYEVRDE